MSKHEDHVSMRHMLDHARKACQMVEGRTRSDLDSDEMLKYALTRLVEIVGEAASRVSIATRDRYQGIPWPDIVGMRNRLIHGYDVVDLDLLWDTIEDDLPPLMEQLRAILGESK
ncbi:MAG: DUF86 domain-containing protein [Thermodesulfobacteriota bacterium]